MTDYHTLKSTIDSVRTDVARLRGETPIGAGDAVALQANADLRRQVDTLRKQLPPSSIPGYLTEHQVAARLGLTVQEVRSEFGKNWPSGPSGLDKPSWTPDPRTQIPVIAEQEYENYVLYLDGSKR